jgi:hypothetical protein
MKKLLPLLLLVVGMMSTTMAQSATLMTTVAGDTVIATGGMDTVSKVITATAGYSALGVQVNTTKVSGTISLKAYLYGSLDGTNYQLTDSSAAFTDVASNVAYFTKSTTPFVYYKVQVRPVGQVATTQSAAVKVYYVLRKYNP